METMSASVFNSYLQEGDAKALARIDEILARSKKVVEESMELSKRTIEQKIKIDNVLETSLSTENSFLFPKKVSSKVLELPEEAEVSESLDPNYEKAAEDTDLKINTLETKALQDEKTIRDLTQRVNLLQNSNKPSSSKLEYEVIQADKLINNLKQTLNVGLLEENKNLKAELENLLKNKSDAESNLRNQLDEIVKEKKKLEMQYNNLKYLHGNAPSYLEELENAKSYLKKIQEEFKETSTMLESKIEEQTTQNLKLREIAKNNFSLEKVNVIRVKFQEQAKQNLNLLKKINKQSN
jgi:hypothetical protein